METWIGAYHREIKFVDLVFVFCLGTQNYVEFLSFPVPRKVLQGFKIFLGLRYVQERNFFAN